MNEPAEHIERIEFHPQALEYLSSLVPGPPFWERDIDDARREDTARAQAEGGAPEHVAYVRDVTVTGVRTRCYWPRGDEQNALVWFHGGAWMTGDLEAHDALVRALANRAGCAVISVDYRRAPENTYPAAFDDCWTATEWAWRSFDQLAVGGDSSGGNLAAAVALRARDSHLPLALQLLVYPVLDAAAVDQSFYEDFARKFRSVAGFEAFGDLHQECIRKIWEIYIPEAESRLEPYASPARAESLRGVAPALVIEAEHDILRGEGEDYVERLQEAGVSAELVTYAGQIHRFFQLLGVMDDAQDAVTRAASAIKEKFAA
jgi:acetyl esterase